MNDIPGSRTPRENGADQDDQSLISTLRGWLRGLTKGRNGDSVREMLEELIEERGEGETPISEHEKLLLGNILNLRDATADDVMVPRADIIAVDINTSLPDLVQIFNEAQHSRLPVFRGQLDDSLGMIHIKDLLPLVGSDKPFVMSRILRKVLFISPSIRVMDLLVEMRLKRTHMALVVDEYGGVDGLVTIEDLVEQIVGEIEDEHDVEEEPEIRVRPDGVIEADARLSLEEFEDRVGTHFEEDEIEDIDTLGGLVIAIAGRVPTRGELIPHEASGMEFEIVDADPRRIKRLRVRNAPAREHHSEPA